MLNAHRLSDASPFERRHADRQPRQAAEHVGGELGLTIVRRLQQPGAQGFDTAAGRQRRLGRAAAQVDDLDLRHERMGEFRKP